MRYYLIVCILALFFCNSLQAQSLKKGSKVFCQCFYSKDLKMDKKVAVLLNKMLDLELEKEGTGMAYLGTLSQDQLKMLMEELTQYLGKVQASVPKWTAKSELLQEIASQNNLSAEETAVKIVEMALSIKKCKLVAKIAIYGMRQGMKFS